jgi:DNA polymerase III delta prime subunit
MKYLVWSLVLASWVGKAAVEAYGYCSFDIDDLNRTLHDHVKEQEVAVRTVVEKVGNWDEAGRAVPLVLYFNGPTGVGKTHTTNVLAQYLAGHKDKATFESFAAVDNIIRVPIHPDLDCHDTMALLERRLRTIIERNNDKKSCVKVVIFDEVDVLLEGPQTAATHRECKEGGVSLHADSTPLGKPKACHSPCTCKPDDAYFNFYSILKQLKSVNMMNLFDHSRAGIMGELVRLDNLIVILTGGQSIAEQRELLATHYCQDQHLADVTCRQQLMTSSFEQQQEVGAAVMGPRVKAVFREEYSDMVLGGGHSGGRDSTYSGLVPFFYFFQEELKGVAKHLIDEYMTPFYVKELGLASLTVDDSVLLNIVR